MKLLIKIMIVILVAESILGVWSLVDAFASGRMIGGVL